MHYLRERPTFPLFTKHYIIVKILDKVKAKTSLFREAFYLMVRERSPLFPIGELLTT